MIGTAFSDMITNPFSVSKASESMYVSPCGGTTALHEPPTNSRGTASSVTLPIPIRGNVMHSIATDITLSTPRFEYSALPPRLRASSTRTTTMAMLTTTIRFAVSFSHYFI